MELQIISAAGDEIQFSDRLADQYLPYRLPGSTPISTFSPFGNMLFQHFPGAGFDIWYSTYDIEQPVTLIGRADIAVLELHIPFQNPLSTRWDGIVHTDMAEKQFDLSFTPFVLNEVTFSKKGIYQTFDIHYHKQTLQTFAPHFPLLDIFLSQVEKGQPASLFGSTRFITPEMERIIHDMCRYDFLAPVAAAFYECKAMELLIAMLRTVSGYDPQPERFSRVALDWAAAAQKIIQNEPDHIFTSHELARKLGTNNYTLNQAFKHLYNTSLSKYSEQVRMEHARALLLDHNLSVTDVATRVGYNDVQNFSIAFKRYFHFPPGELKRQRKTP